MASSHEHKPALVQDDESKKEYYWEQNYWKTKPLPIGYEEIEEKNRKDRIMFSRMEDERWKDFCKLQDLKIDQWQVYFFQNRSRVECNSKYQIILTKISCELEVTLKK